MTELIERVEALSKRFDTLSNVFDHIQKSLTAKQHRQRRSIRTKNPSKRPEWVEEIVQHFNEISAELKSVKKTLDTHSLKTSDTLPSNASGANAEAAPEAKLQHETSSQIQHAEQAIPAIPENGQQESVTTNTPKPVGLPSPPSPPGKNIMTKEPPPVAHQLPVSCEVSLRPSTLTEPLSCMTPLNDLLLDLQSEHLRLRERGRLLVEAQANKRTHLLQDKVAAVQPNAIPSKRTATQAGIEANKGKAVQAKSQLTPKMGSLLEAVCGKDAFHHLCSLIYSWRDRSKMFFENNDGGAPAAKIVQAIGFLGKRSRLDEFLDRFLKVKLAEEIDEGKDGRIRADPEAITNLINGLRWEDTKTSRRTLRGYLQEGRQWKLICGGFDGLLCLIPPNREDRESPRISGRTFQELSGIDIELFHSLLKANECVQPLCHVGKTFQASIWNDAEVPEFKWEGEDPKEISRLSIKELTPFMEEFYVITENEYKLEEYDWPKPDRWLWDWPQHPMWVPSSDRQCDLCNLCTREKICNCIITCLPENKPRITNEGGKGQGVRAIGLTYMKDQIIGEFCGEIVPLDTHEDGWPMEFIRPDLNDEPVAQIYPRKRGNWVRKVNHSCDPSAKFRVMKISGWWRQMLVAIRDIPHNSEITAFCGRNFLKGQGKECFCEGCSGHATPQRG